MLNLLNREEWRTAHKKGLGRLREESARNPPRREMKIHAEPVFCGRSLGDKCFLKDALSHPRARSSLLLYFIPRSVGAAESARRFH